MVINSFSFLFFFIIVFLLYYFPFKENTKAQNWLLLLSSYFFYGYADWRMIPLLIISTFIFYLLGIALSKAATDKISYWLITLGIFFGVGILFYFKYFNFFIESFASLFNSVGLNANWGTFNIIMPLGISFFTFKLISYIIEIYRGKIEVTKDFVEFATYIAFFPTLLSGPIDRPNIFIPQLLNKRSFNYDLAVDGCRQILWGMFKKMVIADNLALIVNVVWLNTEAYNSSTLLIIAILYTVQLYTDFSGYSDMAIGVGKILGFRIAINFKYPFFARNVSEFWRCWHISLTSWVTEYVFMPLNIKFRNLGKYGIMLAILINMLVVGLWHGANWTFVFFGLYHGLLFIPLILIGSFYNKKKLETNKFGLPNISDFASMGVTFMLITFSLIFFRAINIEEAFSFIHSMTSLSLFDFPVIPNGMGLGFSKLLFIFSMIPVLIIVEWLQRSREYALSISFIKIKAVRWAMYLSISYAIIMLYSGSSEFIYFQF